MVLSEMLDTDQMLVPLSLGDREVLCKSIVYAVLCQPDHGDIYDAMFDLCFPAALGACAVVINEEVEMK